MKDKPQYNILQNLAYLLKTCWRVSKGLLWMILVITILQLLTNMTELYIAPMILQKVERSVPLGEVLLTIGGFTLALVVFVGARSYLTETKPIFASRFFNHFFRANAMKSATTSYSNTMDTTFLEKREQSGNNMAGNSDSTPPMVMLTQAAELATACVGFVLYLLVLTGLHPIMMVLVIVTTVVGFCVNRYVNKKEFETHSEKLRCANRLYFVTNTAMANEMPKDIRIFHMRPWLLEVYDKAMKLNQAFHNRDERRQFLAKLVDVVLSATRNGIAYVYLIYMVIENDLPASQFLLYFSAVTGFTGWVTTILNSAIQLTRHPNAAAILVLQLGCENLTHEQFVAELGEYDENRVRFLTCQHVEDEYEVGRKILEDLAEFAGQFHREEIPASELVIGMKCGGSDGLSGITANPTVGRFSDLLVAQGGSTVLTEVPEMFGAEGFLMNRCINEVVFHKAVNMINGFKDYFLSHNEAVYENPSPGNKAGGITTLEDKSCGCVQKGGSAPIMDVIGYGEAVTTNGLNMLCGPGNDLVSSTALTAAGAHMVLFTTGRGTPFGAPAPTVKIATNTPLAIKKHGWIDFNAGVVADGTRTLDEAATDLMAMVLEVASGKQTKSEIKGFREISIFKDGVTL